MKKIVKEVGDILSLVILALVYLTGVSLVAIYLLYWLLPEVWFLGSIILHLPDLRFILLGLVGAMMMVAGLQKKWQIKNIRENWKTKLVTAWMLAYFLKYSFSAVGRWGNWGIVVGTIWFYGYINLVEEVLTKVTLKTLWQRIVANRRYLGQALGISLMIGVIGGMSMFGRLKYQQKIGEERAWQAGHPTITRLEPKVVFASNKILIKGNHFGWKQSDQVKLMSDQGEVRTDLWTNEKIIFSVPFAWTNKKVKVWIEKKREWKGKMITDKSEEFEIKVLSLDNLSKKDEKLYYQDLNSLSPEAKELNGY